MYIQCDAEAWNSKLSQTRTVMNFTGRKLGAWCRINIAKNRYGWQLMAIVFFRSPVPDKSEAMIFQRFRLDNNFVQIFRFCDFCLGRAWKSHGWELFQSSCKIFRRSVSLEIYVALVAGLHMYTINTGFYFRLVLRLF